MTGPFRIVCALLLAALAAPAAAQTEKLAVRPDWTPWGAHAAIHLAAEKGWFRQNGIEAAVEDGLLVPRGGAMKGPKDLAGKKIIFTAGSLEAPFLDTFLAAARADGVFSTVPFVVPAVEASRPSDAILFSDYGLQFPSFGLVSSEEKIAAAASRSPSWWAWRWPC